ncbi:MAG: ribosome biogenesis GTP-binding protein YihA/YsxC [Pseudomonadota bacterium]
MSEEFTKQQIEHARKLFAGPCDFMLGVAGLEQLPKGTLPEVAFAGRSNVGKSSLINALTNRNDLARTSNTPGRTQQLNFFNLGDQIRLVDMPGYGYAKVSKKERSDWEQLIFDYLRGRPNLRCVFVLVDARHGLKDSDERLMAMLDEAAVSYRIILTKGDKKAKGVVDDVQASLKKHPAAYPEVHLTSSMKDVGLEELRAIVFGFTD